MQPWKIILSDFLDLAKDGQWEFEEKKSNSLIWKKSKEIEEKQYRFEMTLDRANWGDCGCVTCGTCKRRKFWRMEWKIHCNGTFFKHGVLYICEKCYDSTIESFLENSDHSQLENIIHYNFRKKY